MSKTSKGAVWLEERPKIRAVRDKVREMTRGTDKEGTRTYFAF